jgi:hypothetical protein
MSPTTAAGSSSGVAYATVATGDAYLRAAAVLTQRLRDVGSVHPMLVLSPRSKGAGRNETASGRCARAALSRLGAQIREVELMDVPPSVARDMRWQKLLLWQQVDFTRLVAIDLDTFVVRNLDALLRLNAPLASGIDPPLPCWAPHTWPSLDRPSAYVSQLGLLMRTAHTRWYQWSRGKTIINTGLMSLAPSATAFRGIYRYAQRRGWRFENGDQGAIDGYFRTAGGLELLNESWVAFATRCVCTGDRADRPAVTPSGAPLDTAVIHFGAWYMSLASPKPWVPRVPLPACSMRWLRAWHEAAQATRTLTCADRPSRGVGGASRDRANESRAAGTRHRLRKHGSVAS